MTRLSFASKEARYGRGTFICGKDVFFAIDLPILFSSLRNKSFVCEEWIGSHPPFLGCVCFRVSGFHRAHMYRPSVGFDNRSVLWVRYEYYGRLVGVVIRAS